YVFDARVLTQLRAPRACTVEECAQREICTHDPRFGLVEHRPAVRHADRPTSARAFCIEQLELRVRFRQRVRGTLRRIADELDESVELEHLRPRVPLELAPSLRSEEHTSELQSRGQLVCRLLLERKKSRSA